MKHVFTRMLHSGENMFLSVPLFTQKDVGMKQREPTIMCVGSGSVMADVTSKFREYQWMSYRQVTHFVISRLAFNNHDLFSLLWIFGFR